MTTPKFYTHNQNPISINGTSLQGHVKITFNQLVELFGEPDMDSDDDKSRALWIVQGDSGAMFTIYDWNSKLKPEFITEWSIGGRQKSLDFAREVLSGFEVTSR